MTVNTNKTKVMVIKSNKITYDSFVYDNNNLEEVTSDKYLGIDIHHKLNWNYSIEKMIIGGWKAYYGLGNNYKSVDLWSWDKKKLLFETLVTPVILYGCEVWGCSISRDSLMARKYLRATLLESLEMPYSSGPLRLRGKESQIVVEIRNKEIHYIA
jgi:hypothetical protein